jgi:hypothetical protein
VAVDKELVSMSNSSDKGTNGGMGLMTVLFVVFLILKLCEVIEWSWWWVTAPLWGPFAFLVVVLILCLIGSGIYAMFGSPTKK